MFFVIKDIYNRTQQWNIWCMTKLGWVFHGSFYFIYRICSFPFFVDKIVQSIVKGTDKTGKSLRPIRIYKISIKWSRGFPGDCDTNNIRVTGWTFQSCFIVMLMHRVLIYKDGWISCIPSSGNWQATKV